MVREVVVEKEVYEARRKAKVEILRALHGDVVPDGPTAGATPGIVYDAQGKPRPARMAYDSPYSDVSPGPTPVPGPPPDETDAPDDVNPFPNLFPPLG